MPVHRLHDIITRHGRTAEWMAAAVTLCIGVTFLWPGETVRISSSYAGFRALGMTDLTLGWSASILGAVRLGALYVNGSWRRSPAVRLAGAGLGAMFFAALGMMFQWVYLTGRADAPSTATTYIVVAAFEFLACYGAAVDVVRNRR